jgi:hypothetical protein
MVESSVSFSNMGEIILHGLHQLNVEERSALATRANVQFYELGIEIDQDDFIACMLVQCDLVKGLGGSGRCDASPEQVDHTLRLASRYCLRRRCDEWNARTFHGLTLLARSACR